jgi:hypothetical protein
VPEPNEAKQAEMRRTTITSPTSAFPPYVRLPSGTQREHDDCKLLPDMNSDSEDDDYVATAR